MGRREEEEDALPLGTQQWHFCECPRSWNLTHAIVSSKESGNLSLHRWLHIQLESQTTQVGRRILDPLEVSPETSADRPLLQKQGPECSWLAVTPRGPQIPLWDVLCGSTPLSRAVGGSGGWLQAFNLACEASALELSHSDYCQAFNLEWN